MMDSQLSDPHAVLELKPDATPDEVRQAYLNLVRRYPPDQEPDKFREIYNAYKLLCDPLAQAEVMFRPAIAPPNLEAIIAAAENRRPRLPKLVLLALGNGDEPS
jgi:hypothetical protein